MAVVLDMAAADYAVLIKENPKVGKLSNYPNKQIPKTEIRRIVRAVVWVRHFRQTLCTTATVDDYHAS